MSNKLRGKSLLLVGFTLFSMFFGAGNLIFPPFLGAEAGQNAWAALAGFAVSAIGLPIAGVIAVARAGSLGVLASRVHPRFALVFTMLIYLSIGPCLAIPRTASTSFQMLAPFIGSEGSHQLLYSAVFFAAAFAVALHPEKLTVSGACSAQRSSFSSSCCSAAVSCIRSRRIMPPRRPNTSPCPR